MPLARKFFPDLVLVFVATALLLVNLQYSPGLWFDEGAILHVAKNLALYGQYGTRVLSNFDLFDPFVTSGPALIVPVAVLLRFLGVGVLQARLVAIAYALALLVALLAVARRLGGKFTAVAAGIILVFGTEYLMLSREVMGEVPATCLAFLGLILWDRARQQEKRVARYGLLAGTGLLWGGAVLTKNMMILLFLGLLLYYLVMRFYRSPEPWSVIVIPLVAGGAMLAIWYSVQLAVLGRDMFLANLVTIRQFQQVQAACFCARRMLGTAKDLVLSPLVWVGALGVAELVSMRRRPNPVAVLIASLIVTWFAWYVIASIGWTRYAFTGMALLTIPAALWLHWVWEGRSPVPLARLWSFVSLRYDRLPLAGRRLGVVLIVGLGIAGSPARIADAVFAPDYSVASLAHVVGDTVPEGDAIETWEWQVGFLIDRDFHYPSFAVEDVMIRHVQLGTPLPDDLYDPRSYPTQWLIDGPFNKWTHLYTEGFLKQNYVLVRSVGPYDLYRRLEPARP